MKYEAIESLLEKLVQEIHQKHAGDPLAIGYSFVHANSDLEANLAINRIAIDPMKSEIFQKEITTQFLRWYHPYGDPRCTRQRTYIPKPLANETLMQYLSRLQGTAPNIFNISWWRSLHRFLNLLCCYENTIGGIEQIFPKEMGVFNEEIVRRIPLAAYPIDVVHAGKIIQQLFNDAVTERANGRKNTLQALALSWICLIASKTRLPTQLQMLSKITKESLDRDACSLSIPTLFGKYPVPISPQLKAFFYEMQKLIPSEQIRLLNDIRVLRRPFEKALSKIPGIKKLGQITFLTLISPPHFAIGHRYQRKIAIQSMTSKKCTNFGTIDSGNR